MRKIGLFTGVLLICLHCHANSPSFSNTIKSALKNTATISKNSHDLSMTYVGKDIASTNKSSGIEKFVDFV